MIKVNKAQCRLCLDIIESKSVHDFVRCKCGHIFLDGGHEYRRCGVAADGVYEDIIWLEE